ncbi:MAG: hypothetical protein ACXABU_16570, partial [Candidatus Hodarchaeales archaeon]
LREVFSNQVIPMAQIRAMMNLIIVGGLFLGIGVILIYRAQKNQAGLTLLIYGILNLIGILIAVPLHSFDVHPHMGVYYLKGLIVPILGIISFRLQMKYQAPPVVGKKNR